MLKDFEQKLRLLFEDALKKGKFHNTFIALKTGDHYLELILHALHNDWDGQSSTFLYLTFRHLSFLGTAPSRALINSSLTSIFITGSFSGYSLNIFSISRDVFGKSISGF